MATKGISGIGGDVLIGTGPSPVQVAEVTKWSFNPKGTNPGYRSNRTAGFTTHVAGYKEASGSVECKLDPTAPLWQTLDICTFVTLNLQTITGQRMVVPAIVDNIKLDVDIEGAAVVGISFDWSSTGAWTYGTATAGLMGPMPGVGGEAVAPAEGQPQQAQPQAPGGQPQPAPQGIMPIQAGGQQGPDPQMVAAVTQAVLAALAQKGQAA